MILSDREIELAMQGGRIVITPRPQKDAFSPSSVDLTLADQYRVWKDPVAGAELTLSPEAYSNVSKFFTERLVIPPDGFRLPPKSLMLAWTSEQISIPAEHGIAARVEGKSSLGRMGIGVHITAPTIHPGFQGPIQLEIVSHGPHPVLLKPGMKICQIIFELTMGTPTRAYEGQFQHQKY